MLISSGLNKVKGVFKRKETFRQGFIVSSSLNIVSKALGFFVSILTAFFFGSSPETDIFFYSISTVGIFSSFLINLDSTMVIPRFMHHREMGEKEKSNNLLSFFFWAFFLVTVFIAIAIFFAPVKWLMMFSRFTEPVISSHTGIIRWTGPLLVITTLNYFLIDVLGSFKRFSLAIVSGFLCSIINVLVIASLHKPIGVQSVVIGNLLGSVFQGAFLLFCVLRLSGCRFWPTAFPLDRKSFQYLLISQAAYVCSLFGSFLPLYFLSGFSAGIISALGYGLRINDMLSFILLTQFSNIIGIKFNELHIKKEFEKHPDFFIKTGKASLLFSIPIIVVFSILSFECISTIFMRGKFHYQEAIDAARFVSVFVFLIPFLIINTMVARLVMAAHKLDKFITFQMIMGVLLGAICYIGIHIFGPWAYPFSMILSYAINLLTVNYLLKRWFPWLHGFYRMLFYGVKIFAVNSLIIPLDFYIKKSMIQWHPIEIIAIVGLMHAIVFSIIVYAFKLYIPVREVIADNFIPKTDTLA